jgi:hypothetical protein
VLSTQPLMTRSCLRRALALRPPTQLPSRAQYSPEEFYLYGDGHSFPIVKPVTSCHPDESLLKCGALHTNREAILENLKLLAELFDIRDRAYEVTAESLEKRLKLKDLIESLEAEIKRESLAKVHSSNG